MLRVCFNCYGSYTTDTVFQWDLNHILEIRGLTVDHAPTVHFCNRKSETAIVVQSEIDGDAIIAPVPNQLLQEPYNIIAYVHVYNDNNAKTVEIVNIPLIKRVKPDDYQFIDNVDVMNFERLEKDITDFIALMETRFNDHTTATDNTLSEFNTEIENFEEDVNETLAEIKRETLTVDGRAPGEDPDNARSYIKPRRGTATLWSEANPVLAEGEIGIELPEDGSNLIKIKIGDGVKAWNALPYGVAPLEIVDNLLSTSTDLPLSANQGRVLKSDIDTKLSKSGGQITGNITGTQNGFKIAPTGDIYSDKWGSKWLSTALGEKLSTSGGHITGNIYGSSNSACFAPDGNIYSDLWGGWLTGYLANHNASITNHNDYLSDLTSRFPKTCAYPRNNDWNNATETGFYMGFGYANAPINGTWFMGFAIAHNTGYVIQELYCFVDGMALTECRKFTRRCYEGTWLAWVQEPQFTYNASTGTLDITL